MRSRWFSFQYDPAAAFFDGPVFLCGKMRRRSCFARSSRGADSLGADVSPPTIEDMAISQPVSEPRHARVGPMAPRHPGRRLPWPIARALGDFTEGRLEVVDGATRYAFGEPGASPAARVDVHDARTWRAVLFGGTIGAAEAYAEGWWSADDLTALIRLVARNERAAAGLDGWLSRAGLAVHSVLHRLRANRRWQSRRNISAHYDLGNEFFAHFLDPSMTYSCAIFPSRASSLEEASRNKLDLICRRLDLSAADDVLEIGTGWGSLALHAASRYGCRVTTTTISAEQYRHARTAVSRAGLDGRVTVLDADYRDLPRVLRKRFDKLVSVEMIEAVGQRFMNRYLEVCDALAKPGGRMLLQAIVIADDRYEAYRRSVDVIQRHVFPGGFLPCLADLRARLGRATAFSIAARHDITEHYPRTLQCWRERLAANRERLEALGYPRRLLRLWDYYFSYCEGGFLERTVGVVQLLMNRAVAA